MSRLGWTFLITLTLLAACAQTPEGTSPKTTEGEAPTPEIDRDPPSAEADPPEALQSTVQGYSKAQWTNQRGLEARIALDVRPARCADFLRDLTAAPHPPGSEKNRQIGRLVAEHFESFGLRVETDTYEVLVPTPLDLAVEMESPLAFSARLSEPPLDSDFDTRSRDTLRPYAAFSPDADLEAELLYANYGREEDLAQLREAGIDPTGKILLCRSGSIYRGSKVWLAERAGAAGVLIYSDPADNGFARGEVHPAGRFRPAEGASRGTVLYTFLHPGDPGTPGKPSRPGADQLTFDEMRTLPGIPVTTLSFSDARPLLEGLGGPVVPPAWRGAGSFTYHYGGAGKCQVRLELTMDYRLRPTDTVTAVLAGGDLASQEIMVCCHRDAWTHGAIDPGSGHAVLLEVARLLAARRDDDDALRRSVRFLSFGAEELGLVGSTEWMEDHREEIGQHAVVVIDLDAAISGTSFEIGASSPWRQICRSVGTQAPEGSEARMRFTPPYLDADHAPFLGHLGIPALSVGLRGEHGLAHSRYDTFSALRRHLDPDFKRHARVAEYVARLVARIANAETIPRDFAALGDELLARIDATEKAHPELDLAPLREPATRLVAAGRRLATARRALLTRGPFDVELARALDDAGRDAERALVLSDSKEFWRHALHAPSPETGYTGPDLPSLERSLAEGRGPAQRAGAALADRFTEIARRVEVLADRLEQKDARP